MHRAISNCKITKRIAIKFGAIATHQSIKIRHQFVTGGGMIIILHEKILLLQYAVFRLSFLLNFHKVNIKATILFKISEVKYLSRMFFAPLFSYLL